MGAVTSPRATFPADTKPAVGRYSGGGAVLARVLILRCSKGVRQVLTLYTNPVIQIFDCIGQRVTGHHMSEVPISGPSVPDPAST